MVNRQRSLILAIAVSGLSLEGCSDGSIASADDDKKILKIEDGIEIEILEIFSRDSIENRKNRLKKIEMYFRVRGWNSMPNYEADVGNEIFVNKNHINRSGKKYSILSKEYYISFNNYKISEEIFSDDEFENFIYFRSTEGSKYLWSSIYIAPGKNKYCYTMKSSLEVMRRSCLRNWNTRSDRR